MKSTLPYLLICLLLLPATEAIAQNPSDGINLTSSSRPVIVRVGAAYQRFEAEGRSLSELSFPVSLFVPLTRQLSLGAQVHQANASGDGLESVQGLDDVQLALTYAQPVGEASIVASVAANLPSGKRKLSLDQFQTTVNLSQNFFGFRVPGFGQGFNIAPSLTGAFPVNDDLVLGAGLVYQYRGSYQPLEDIDGDYTPGDEIQAVVGLEYRLAPQMTLSADVAHTRYTDDEINEEAVLALGALTTTRLQWQLLQGYNEFRIDGRYDYRAASTVLDGAQEEDQQTVPSEGSLAARYRARISPLVYLGVVGRARYYGETEGFNNLLFPDALQADAKTLFDLGLEPELRLTQQATLTARFLYTLGDFTGFEAGAGVRVRI